MFLSFTPPPHNRHPAESLIFSYFQPQTESLMVVDVQKCDVRSASEFYSPRPFVSRDLPAADIVCSASPCEPLWDCRSQLLHCASQRQHI